jgi:hypothetical protein
VEVVAVVEAVDAGAVEVAISVGPPCPDLGDGEVAAG